MSETTQNLGLRLLSTGQAQKEVTINEALASIDALLNRGAADKDLATPPAEPDAGLLYIVGAAATGDWAGHEGDIAYYDQIWRFVAPNEGMVLWVNDEDVLYAYDGSNWVVAGSGDSVTQLGINATADSGNKLTVKSDAVLFDHNGDHSRVKVNKATSSDTASHLFQVGYSGRAEFGLTGDDHFHLKMSPDGTNWYEALSVSKDNLDVTVQGDIDVKGGLMILEHNVNPLIFFNVPGADPSSSRYRISVTGTGMIYQSRDSSNTFIADDYLMVRGAQGATRHDYKIKNVTVVSIREGELQLTGVLSANGLAANAGATLTIASGVVTATHSRHRIDTQGAAAADDLDTINGSPKDGQLLILSSANNGRDVTVRSGVGNIQLASNLTLSHMYDTLTLIWSNSDAKWLELSRSDNAA